MYGLHWPEEFTLGLVLAGASALGLRCALAVSNRTVRRLLRQGRRVRIHSLFLRRSPHRLAPKYRVQESDRASGLTQAQPPKSHEVTIRADSGYL